MNNKKGFTLVELLAVVVLICLITIIGTAGVIGIKHLINNELWKNTVSLVENGAIHYGEDHSYLFTSDKTCSNGASNCLEVSVQSLITRGYLFTKEVDDENNKVLVDRRKQKNEGNYYINNYCVYIYTENELFYAELVEESC